MSKSVPPPSAEVPQMHPHTDGLAFCNSSYSDRNNCVEVARYRKSSYSSGRQENCVEVADLAAGVAVRDSKFPDHSHLLFPGPEWVALLHTN